jgi:mannosyltransferase OCH1-like enzyme
MIPRIIHQIWLPMIAPEMPARFRASQDSWKAQHPGWEYHLWTGEEIDRLVREHYPDLSRLFYGYPDWIQRVDVARYMILHHHGGIYSDLDIICRRPFDDLLANEVVLPKTEPIGVSNDLILSEKGHPFFSNVLAQLETAFSQWQRWFVPRHFRVMLTTSPLFLTLQYRAFLPMEAITLLRPDQYGAAGSPHTYVTHIEGNTWAKWDTHFFIFVSRRWRRLVGAAALIAALTALAMAIDLI